MTSSALDILMAAGAAFSVLLGSFRNFSQKCDELPQEVLRLHILADSDSSEDQQIKLAVRDFILEEYGGRLAQCATRAQAEEAVRDMLPQIEEACCALLEEQDAEYGATAELTEMYFSTRQYDSVTLPAGDYLALRITLGEGGGHNWWCVIFPSLCIPAAAEKSAEGLLPADFVAENSPSEKHIEIKFAVYEFFKRLFT